MSKQPLSPLSSIIPVKGEAARVEVLAETPAPGSGYSAPAKEIREGLTIRVVQEDNALLREASFKEGRSKQSLLDQAIREFLIRTGYRK